MLESIWVKLGVIALGTAVVVVLFIALSGGDHDRDPQSDQPAGDVDGGPVGGGAGGDPVDPGSGNGDSGGERTETPRREIQTIEVRGGKPVGGVAELDYRKGDRVRFRVRSDVTDEVHVHGYDLIEDVEAGGSVSFDFPADIDGLFEVELEQSHSQLATLRVSP